MPTTTIALDPAGVLYQQKLRVRRGKDMPHNLVSLPSLRWETERAKLKDFDNKTIAQLWVRYLAHAVSAIGAGRADDFGLVALMQLSWGQDQVTIRFVCPYPQVMDNLRNGEARALFEKSPVDVQHKYGLVEDTWCPLVLVHSVANKHVLVTNQNHLSDPEQFLDVERCDMTSGLLNFIGSLCLIEASGAENPSADGKRWVQAAMAARRDEWLRWFFHLAETRALLDLDRILIDPLKPETWCFDGKGDYPRGA